MINYYDVIAKKLVDVEADVATWIHLSAPLDHSELEYLSEIEDFPLDFLLDSLDIDERSRYEREDDAKLIVINAPVLNQDEKESDALYITAPIGIIISRERVITISALESPVLEKFIRNRVKNFNPADKELFVLQLFEQTVYEYLDCLKKLNLKRNLIEKELYNSSRNRELQQLLRIEKSLVYMLNSLSDNDLLKQKIKRTDFLNIRQSELHQDLFEDIVIDNSQALEMANVHTNILGGTMEAYASIISNNLNVVIHKLTIITIILMVPTLVASFYGMNLDYLPLKEFKGAFFLIIFISVLLGLGLIGIFRKTNNY
jgi:magnesium transporter